MAKNDKMDKIVQLLARRGFIYQSGEIYGGFAGFFDFGNYGAKLKRNIEKSWWDYFITSRNDIVGMDGSIISPNAIWNASGHLKEFTDPLIECAKCQSRYRADQLIEDELKISVEGYSIDALNKLIKERKLTCEKCKGDLEIAKPFNLMFATHVGAAQDESAIAYLRPETAQHIFVNFKQMQITSRKQLPFGIGQIGKAFRNEISPRNFVFRCREFTQMEIEYFIHPEKLNDCPYLESENLTLEINVLTSAMQEKAQEGKKFQFKELVEKKIIGTKWHAYLVLQSYKWFLSLGIKQPNLRIREHVKTELSHYSKETWDLEYNYPWGWKELSGIANRSDYDLKQHMLESKKDLTYFDEESKKKILPFVIEPSFGLERALLTCVLDSFEEKIEIKKETVAPNLNGNQPEAETISNAANSDDPKTQLTPNMSSKSTAPIEEKKNILHLPPSISPIQVAIFPLMKKDGLAELAKSAFASLQGKFACEYDESGSIGRRYARQDEIGTPYCLTIDYDSLQDSTLTIRERDSTKQKRIKIADVAFAIRKLMDGAEFDSI